MAVQLVYTFPSGAHVLDIDGCARSEQWFRTYTKMYDIISKYQVVRWIIERVKVAACFWHIPGKIES
jgi:hypothetical protein